MQTMLLSMAIQSTLLLAAAAIAQWLARRTSAALRHLIWCAAMLSLLLLPVATGLLNYWGAPGPQWVIAQEHSITVTASETAAVRLPWPAIALVLWGGVAALLLARLAAGTVMAFRMKRSAKTVTCVEWTQLLIDLNPTVTLLQSHRTATPLAFGSTIIIPTETADWTADQRRAVLIHELAHIERFDVLTQWLASFACCFYWFQPLAWYAASRMRIEREQAADDAVLSTGIRGSDYAAHLAAVARSMGNVEMPGIAIPMATASTLEARLRAIVAGMEDRGRLTTRQRSTVTLLALIVLLSAAVVRVQASIVSTFDGIVYDAVGAVPNANLTLVERETGRQIALRSNAAGAFHFAGLTAGRYALKVQASGFSEALMPNLEIKQGQKQQYYPQLKLGSIGQQVNVFAARPQQIKPSTNAPLRLRIGGNVQSSRLTYKLNPRYPAEAKKAGIEGAVQLAAVINREGRLAAIHVIHSPDPALTKSATEAVAEWRYSPTLLNGNPVEIETIIFVNYTLTK